MFVETVNGAAGYETVCSSDLESVPDFSYLWRID